MQKVSRNGSGTGNLVSRTRLRKRSQRSWRNALEKLEERVVMAVSFATTSYSPTNVTITATGSGSAAAVEVYAVNGSLAHTGLGGTFASPLDWNSAMAGVQPLSAGAGTSLTINENGRPVDLTIGDPNYPAGTISTAITQNQNVGTASSLTIDDSTDAIPLPVYNFNGLTYLGPGAGPITVNAINTGGVTILGGTGAGTFNITGSYSSNSGTEPVFVTPGSGTNIVNVGYKNTLSGIDAPVVVTDPLGTTTLNILDSKDSTSKSATLDMNSPYTSAPYELTGLSSGIIAYGGGVTTLNIYDGLSLSGMTWNVEATQLGTTTNLFTSGNDLVNITDNGSLSGIMGAFNLSKMSTGTYDDLVIDGSADPANPLAQLAGGATVSTLTNLAPAPITYVTADLNTLTINAPFLGVNFAGGNPIPVPQYSLIPKPGFSFNGGGAGELLLYGDNTTNPFTNETNNASDLFIRPQKYYDSYTAFWGDITFQDSLGNSSYLEYTGLTPIIDIVPVATYVFNDFAYLDQSFSATDGGPYMTPDGSESVTNGIVFASTPPDLSLPSFEGTFLADKLMVTFNAPALLPVIPQVGLNGTVNVPFPSDGLEYLQFNAPTNGPNYVNIIAVPDIPEATGYTGSTGNDTTSVVGMGVPIISDPVFEPEYSLYLNGGGGVNTLSYDAGGETPTIEPDGNGGVLISIPGFGTVDAVNYQVINIINAGTTIVTAGLPRTINTIEGFQNVNAITGTFTASAPININPFPPGAPAPTITPGTLPASLFAATIDWGDPSPDNTAGSILQDASDPSVYYIMGTHTYAANGTYTVTNTVATLGGSFTYTNSTTIPGVTVNVTFTTTFSSTVLTPPSTANVTQGTLAVSVFPIVGTEGLPIAGQPIATFIDAGGAPPASQFSATIDIVSPGGLVTLIPGVVGITQIGNAAQYTVTAPSIPGSAIPESGTYQLEVFVTDNGDPTQPGNTTITVEGAALAVIQDAPLTPALTQPPIAANTGVLFTGPVGAFTDENTFNVQTDFTATIDWGDGTPNSVGAVVGSDGTFTVDGSHTYAKYGSYTPTITVREVDGSTVTILNGATAPGATVTDLPITGVGHDFTSVEGSSSGSVLLATVTDPNLLATAADITAVVTSWGDGLPLSPEPLTVVQVSTTTTPSGTVFDIYGAHNYHEEGTYTFDISISTLDPMNPVLDSITGTATVLDAPLHSSNGPEITGIEGNSTPATAPSDEGTFLGSFTDTNTFSSTSDFLPVSEAGSGGSIVVNWGDGSALQTLTGANISAADSGASVGVRYLLNASHTYVETGTYAYTVTVTDDGGATTSFAGSAIIADAALTAIPTALIATSESPVYPVPQFGVPIFSGPVGAFSDGNPTAPLSDFEATIDWGDGSPNSVGTVTEIVGETPTFDVSGSHTYASSGAPGSTYPITVYVTDVDGSRVTLTNKAAVAPIPIVITGSVLPTSLSGKAGSVDLTNVTSPTFAGTAGPFDNITLYAVPVGTTTSAIIGHTEAGSDGSWSITSSKLPQGQYTILASATDQFGLNATPPVAITTVLNIETTLPVITALSFDRFDATLTVTYQDGLAGMDIPSITNSAFYHISATPLAPNVPVPKLVQATQIFFTPGATPSAPVTVEVVFNHGHMLRGGKYEVVIDSGVNGTGVQDAAGNPLAGTFYGTFPTGDGLPGNFVATIFTFHNTTLPFVPGAGHSPPPAGIDPPAGTKLPKYHAPGRAKGSLVTQATQKIAAKNARLKAHDDALAELVAASKSKKS